MTLSAQCVFSCHCYNDFFRKRKKTLIQFLMEMCPFEFPTSLFGSTMYWLVIKYSIPCWLFIKENILWVLCCSLMSPLWVERNDPERVNMSSAVFPPPDIDWALNTHTHTHTHRHTLSPQRPAQSQRGGTVCSSESQLSFAQRWVYSPPDSLVLHWPHPSMGLQTWPPSNPPLSSMACLEVETPSICRGKFKSGAFWTFSLSNPCMLFIVVFVCLPMLNLF